MKKYILIGILLLIICGLFLLPKQIMKSFKTVATSINKSNVNLDNNLENLHDTISKYKSSNKDLTIHADTIYFQTKRMIEYIEKLRTDLHDLDTIGDNIDNSTKMLVDTKAGILLYNNLKIFYSSAKRDLRSKEYVASIDSLSNDFYDKSSSREWLRDNFNQTPTIAATTLLSKFENDCVTTGVMVLKETRDRIKK